MRPYIIIHMMESVDGRIDCAMTEQIDSSNSYYEALEQLACPSQLMGRVTMQMHYAEPDAFVPSDNTPIGRQAVYKALDAEGYIAAMDTLGKLSWGSSVYDDKPLVVIVSESCPKVYLEELEKQHISWIATGEEKIDLSQAMEILYREFGVKRLAVVGGGHINGAFLETGLVDEVSVMIGAGIDGRRGMTALFDGIADASRPATLLHLDSMEKVGDSTVWLRYSLVI